MKKKLLYVLLIGLLCIPSFAMAKEVSGIRSPQTLYVDNSRTDLYGYNINDENYYRFRDLAIILKGKLDFNLTGDYSDITVYLNEPYSDLGNKDKTPDQLKVNALEKTMTVTLKSGDHEESRPFNVYNIKGFNYFRLRDIGAFLDFKVDYDRENNNALIYTKKMDTSDAEVYEKDEKVILGNERLFTEYSYLIDGKDIGLVTNQTGVDSVGVPTEERLKAYDNTNLVALYSPEHGLDGKHKAGDYVESYYDENLELPVYSIYGRTRKPSPEMLKGVEVLLFDMQDIGSRTYTYMSSLNYCMRAAKENNIPLVVLDRPNPLGGNIVEGYLIEDRFMSFVGVDKLPMAHGMTAGELAAYFNRKIGCQLEVVPLKNWTRDMVWQDTDLPFKQTSPNIPNLESAFMYMATGSGEGTGIGQSEYFHWVGGKNLNSNEYARRLNEAGLPGVKFHPAPKGSRGGVRLEITDYHSFNPARTGVYTLAIANNMRPINVASLKKPYHMFYLIQGNERIANAFREHWTPEQIVEDYQKDVETFKEIRAQYLLY